MTDKTKVVDVYDDEDTISYMIEHYTSAEDSDDARAQAVKEIAAVTGKSTVSVRGKLHALGVYIPKIVPKKGNVVTKDKLADKIASIADGEYGIKISEGEVESLAKANKTVLLKVIKMIEMIDDFEDDKTHSTATSNGSGTNSKAAYYEQAVNETQKLTELLDNSDLKDFVNAVDEKAKANTNEIQVVAAH